MAIYRKFAFSDEVVRFLEGVGWSEERNVDTSAIEVYYRENGFLWNASVEKFLSSFLDIGFAFALGTGIALPISFYAVDLVAADIVTAHNVRDGYHIDVARIAIIDEFLEDVFLTADDSVYLISHSMEFRARSIEEFFEYLVRQRPMECLV